ncbi:nucleoside deaminase [Proteiniclasticum sp. QWL-01]|uniref:nucleoside deaminase n=1 Tax=Proteiniclasticum sp. QWL-01 TaxID=3036945 RepID=UPI00241146EC|nr:nucleoside deaminase [Proteiniclasticum sp. QWL-01]WFF73104.1 nucleoside deaminase [Proteiniclasticum sp. QWL-01]
MKTTPNQTPGSTKDQTLTDADHQSFMTEALAQAQLALEQGEIPVGCVIVRDGAVIGRGHNEKEGRKDPSAHAEVLAIQDAARRIGDWRLNGCVLYVTLEPCPMCASLITQSRIREVHVALHEVQSGALGTVLDLTHDPLNHIQLRVKWDYRSEAEALLDEFFQSKKRKPGGTGDESERL